MQTDQDRVRYGSNDDMSWDQDRNWDRDRLYDQDDAHRGMTGRGAARPGPARGYRGGQQWSRELSGGNRWGDRGYYGQGGTEIGYAGPAHPNMGQDGYGMSGYGQGSSGGRYGQGNGGQAGYLGGTGTMSGAGMWQTPGPHTGKGPQGYQRSDDRIRDDVCDMLTQHGQLDASGIEVQVHHGEVTLLGSVTDRQSKRMAEDVAEAATGVKDVHNQLRVQQQHMMPSQVQG